MHQWALQASEIQPAFLVGIQDGLIADAARFLVGRDTFENIGKSIVFDRWVVWHIRWDYFVVFVVVKVKVVKIWGRYPVEVDIVEVLFNFGAAGSRENIFYKNVAYGVQFSLSLQVVDRVNNAYKRNQDDRDRNGSNNNKLKPQLTKYVLTPLVSVCMTCFLLPQCRRVPESIWAFDAGRKCKCRRSPHQILHRGAANRGVGRSL